jgi:hypothetical protein
MKSFTSVPFFLLFERIMRCDNPGLSLDRWSAHGVGWNRARHSFNSPTYSFALELFTAAHSGKGAWTLLVAKEHWWGGRHEDVIKTQQWARPMKGTRQSILKWFGERDRSLKRQEVEHQ